MEEEAGNEARTTSSFDFRLKTTVPKRAYGTKSAGAIRSIPGRYLIEDEVRTVRIMHHSLLSERD